jgi:hypothetical protein
MNKFRCYSCERELPEGSLKYVVEIKSFADFDGFLEDYRGDAESGMLELLEEMEDMDQKAMEEDVYHEIVFVLCKDCRDKFYKKPFKAGEQFCLGEEVKGSIH